MKFPKLHSIILYQSLRNVLLLILLMLFSVSIFSQKPIKIGTSGISGSLWIGAFAGPSLLVEKAPDTLFPELQNYFNNLRSGRHYGFETEYFFNKYIGIGAKYVSFKTKQEVDSLVVQFFSTVLYIDLSNEMIIHTLTPMVYGRLPFLDDKLSITGGIGPAWLLYRNIGKAVGDTAMFKGSSPGLSTSLRVTYEVIPNINIGVQTNHIHAILKEYTQDNGATEEVNILEEKDYQNISRLDFSFGIYYTFRCK